MTTWEDIFQPVLSLGREVREGQAILGQAVVDVIENGGSLLGNASTGTGKSFAILVPMIHQARQNIAEKRQFKGIVSTETITLQSQLCDSDLPFLSKLYPGFTFRKLLGRSNYLCLNFAALSARGNMETNVMVQKLETRQIDLGDGEKRDVERILGKELTPREWEYLAGSSKFCADNQCDKEKCYSARARELAMIANIVVVNHAILATDIEMKAGAGGGAFADGMLGQIDVLAVDEGHQLEPVLVSQWTKEISDWELQEISSSVQDGIDKARSVKSNAMIGYNTNNGLEDMQDVLTSIQRFFLLLSRRANEEWKGSSSALCMKYLSGSVAPEVMAAMREYEEENPLRLKRADQALRAASKYLKECAKDAAEQGSKGLRKINKGHRAANELLEMIEVITKALETRDGIVNHFGTYGCIVDGWERRDGKPGMTVRLVPLDISAKAKNIWAGVRSNILLSATLTDLTDGSFRYAKSCVAFPDGAEVNVETPFNLAAQQLVYMTPANSDPVEGTRYSFTELVDLLNASRGRALVLFTSRQELDWAARELLQLRASGHFDYPVYVQEKDSNKTKLMENFKSNINSVLLATRSFFTGIDVQGESLSLVVLAKFPLPRYSVECRQQITHWRTRGFARWYERESLTVFQQAAGRLIRSSDCTGVVAVLDHRVMDTTNGVYKTAAIGVNALGSPVTQDLETVRSFLK